MTDFVMNNMDTIGSLLIALIMVIWAIVTKQWTVLKVAAYKLMLSAEMLIKPKREPPRWK